LAVIFAGFKRLEAKFCDLGMILRFFAKTLAFFEVWGRKSGAFPRARDIYAE
jgi:hypothetical protein